MKQTYLTNYCNKYIIIPNQDLLGNNFILSRIKKLNIMLKKSLIIDLIYMAIDFNIKKHIISNKIIHFLNN